MRCLIILFGLFFWTSNTEASPPKSVLSSPTLALSPTIEDYETFYNKMENMTKDFTSFDSWADISFKNKTTNKTIDWKDISDYEKTMFCLTMAERATLYFTEINNFWQKELEKFDKPGFQIISKPDAKDKQKPALKENVQLYVNKLLALRKKFALEYENFAVKSFEKYKKEIPEFERTKILKDIRDYHDKHNLIERK